MHAKDARGMLLQRRVVCALTVPMQTLIGIL